MKRPPAKLAAALLALLWAEPPSDLLANAQGTPGCVVAPGGGGTPFPLCFGSDP
eukprot:CAMPEP_0172552738 /NCGR_PEP_ID=MMETSP1067-20121228/47166_1 /TAXON_ID=265564 ORGANISM="Thalassiosira punctigera, Strain Tpunct2005C2" /NCGR_SAMPLE_ID=MMETSP1067 /ASSEMBLY_ACC=CAM_ASM_000444 /LENGTH=53 /DNA_ID=CAMNT_0013340789 /DNA_START=200 /DNA_END=358 /DNA_ORIENTATION=-